MLMLWVRYLFPALFVLVFAFIFSYMRGELVYPRVKYPAFSLMSASQIEKILNYRDKYVVKIEGESGSTNVKFEKFFVFYSEKWAGVLWRKIELTSKNAQRYALYGKKFPIKKINKERFVSWLFAYVKRVYGIRAKKIKFLHYKAPVSGSRNQEVVAQYEFEN